MNTSNIDYFADFKSELAANIKRTITQLKRTGTVSMSNRNLLQVTPTPRIGGPIGSNAQWIYAEMFNEEIAKLSKPYRAFIYNI